MNIIYYSIYFLTLKCILGVKRANWILFPCYRFMVRSSRTIGNIEIKRSYLTCQHSIIGDGLISISNVFVSVCQRHFQLYWLFFRTIVFGYQVKHLFGSFHSLNKSTSLFVVVVLVCQVTVDFTSGCTHLNCLGL